MRTYNRETKDIHARRGETFVVVLSSQPGGGYTWRVDAEVEFVHIVSHTVQPGGQAIGAAALDEFVFEAVHGGSTTLEFRYGRPWEQSPAEAWQVPVTIENGAQDARAH
jgi:predicted secreted protein